MFESGERLRVALLAGTLGQGGAEKQLSFMARALRDAAVDVRVYCLTRDEFYEKLLRQHGFEPIYVGRFANPLLRIASLAKALRPFRPHILQSAHFYTNLYVAIVGRMLGCLHIGSIRNDTNHELASNGLWGPWLLRSPQALLTNSQIGRRNAEAHGVRSERLHSLANVLDVEEFDARYDATCAADGDDRRPSVMAVCRLVAAKRLDRFLMALDQARHEHPQLHGVIVGDGPERQKLEDLARRLELLPDGIRFLGRRDDVPRLLSQADALVCSSDHEGFPNVILEAMAARLPVITTPAGDAPLVVEDGVTGYVVGFNDVEAMAERMVRLVKSPELCCRLGQSGRRKLESVYSSSGLADRLLSFYRDVALQLQETKLLGILSA